jgi:DNA mismatch endonuclease (patch repair protein)
MVAVFVDGCFWHGCPLHSVRPKTHTVFWATKLSGNAARDHRQTAALTASGWLVLRFWEHEVDNDPAQVAEAVLAAVKSRT